MQGVSERTVQRIEKARIYPPALQDSSPFA
jgi:hypothetical protein